MRLGRSWSIGVLLFISIFKMISPAQTISNIYNSEFNPKETNVDTLEKTYYKSIKISFNNQVST